MVPVGSFLTTFMSLLAAAPLAEEFCLLCFFCLGFALCRTVVMKQLLRARRQCVASDSPQSKLAQHTLEEVDVVMGSNTFEENSPPLDEDPQACHAQDLEKVDEGLDANTFEENSPPLDEDLQACHAQDKEKVDEGLEANTFEENSPPLDEDPQACHAQDLEKVDARPEASTSEVEAAKVAVRSSMSEPALLTSKDTRHQYPESVVQLQQDIIESVGKDADAEVSKTKDELAKKSASGSSGSAIAYSMIVRGYAQQKDAARALECYEEMKASGVSVGMVVLNTLVDACCRAGDMSRAAGLLQDMADHDLSPDLITYSTLIKGYCVQGDLDHALELFGAMRRRGIKPDAIVFNSLLDGCARKEMPMLCEQVIEDMVSAGVQPSNYSASILIKLYGRISDLNAAFKVLDEMPRKFGFRPNAAVYTTLMSSCTWNGRMDLAMTLLERMHQDGQTPDEKTYATLLRGATRFGQCEHIVTLLWEVAEQSQKSRKLLLETDVAQSALQTIMKRRAWSQQGGEDCLHHLRRAGFNVYRPEGQDRSGYTQSNGGCTRKVKGSSHNRVRHDGRRGAAA